MQDGNAGQCGSDVVEGQSQESDQTPESDTVSGLKCLVCVLSYFHVGEEENKLLWNQGHCSVRAEDHVF